MFTFKNLFTALTLTTAVTTAAFADEPMSNLELQTNYLVATALNEVQQDMTLGVTYDVLSASNDFEPLNQNQETLVAEITITPIQKTVTSNNNDA